MTSAARSIVYFGVYLTLLGLVLLVAPNTLLSLFGMASASEVWIRVLGSVVAVLGAYYMVMGRAAVTAFFHATLWGRAWIFVSILALVAIGIAEPPLLLIGVLDLLGAIWTWRGLKSLP